MDEKAPTDEIESKWNNFQAWRAMWGYRISLALLLIFLVLMGLFFLSYPSDFANPQIAFWALLMVSMPAAGAVIFYVTWRRYQN